MRLIIQVKELQPCTMSARSIMMTKGFHLRPTCGLELQAITVSLDPNDIPKSAPRPTRLISHISIFTFLLLSLILIKIILKPNCRLAGGDGTFGVSEDLSHFFFCQDLKERLNRKLSRYLTESRRHLYGLDEDCARINMQRDLAEPIRDFNSHPTPPMRGNSNTQSERHMLPPVLRRAAALVKEHLNDGLAILEDMDEGRWRCLLAPEHARLPYPQRSLRQAYMIGQTVMVDARLVEERNKIQYVAQHCWDRRTWPEEESRTNEERIANPTFSQGLINQYMVLNSEAPPQSGPVPRPVTSPPTARQARTTATIPTPQPQPPARLPTSYENQEGTVLKLLDENYGLIEVDQNGMVLFDVCDFWVDPSSTASKRDLKLPDLVRQGSRVLFHATMLNGRNSVQYLASAVWQAEVPFPMEARPRPIPRDGVHKEKEAIYNTVVSSIGSNILNNGNGVAEQGRSNKVPATPALEYNPMDAARGQMGIVRIIFVRKGGSFGQDEQVGGLLETGHNTYCFFLRRDHVNDVIPNLRLFCNYVRVRNSCWRGRVDSVAFAISLSKDSLLEDREDPHRRVMESFSKLMEIGHQLGHSPAFLANPSMPESPYVRLQLEERSENRDYRQQPTTGEREERLVTGQAARFKGMVTANAGILEDAGNLIYFELSDVNIQPLLPLEDLVEVLQPCSGCRVQYQATKVRESTGVVHLAAVTGGVQVLGAVPKDLVGRVRFLQRPSSQQQTSTRTADRLKRYLTAETSVARGEIRTAEDLLASRAPAARMDLLARRRGTVKAVLNDNFGLIEVEGGGGDLCLFDTFDLHTSYPGGQTAAELSKRVGDVVRNGDLMWINACLVDSQACVPYLATAVWSGDSPGSPVDAIGADAVQANKLVIYRTVVQSIGPVVAGLRRSRGQAAS